MDFDKEVFLGKVRCKQCGAKPLVSETYARAMLVISEVLGFGLPWLVHLPHLLILALGPLSGFIAVLALGFPLSFAILLLMVRTVPRLIPPPLVLYHNRAFTALNLTSDPDEQEPDIRPKG